MIDASTAIWGGVALIGILGSAVCSGTEIGLYSVNRVRLSLRFGTGTASPAERRLKEELDHPERALATILIANTVFNNLGAVGITAVLTNTGFSDGAVIALNVAVLTPLLFVFGETVPKELFRSGTDATTSRMAVPLRVMRWLLTVIPFIPLLQLFMLLVSRIAGAGSGRLLAEPRLRIAVLLKEGAGHGVISEEQALLLDRALALRDDSVRSEMTRWASVIRIGVDDNRTRRIARLRSGHSRFAVVDRAGLVVGVVEHADLAMQPDRSIRELMQAPLVIDPGTNVLDALVQMSRASARLAIVGSLARPLGVVTPKDLIEPLTGELESW